MSIYFKIKNNKLLIYADGHLADKIEEDNNSEIKYLADFDFLNDSVGLINFMDQLSSDEFPESLKIQGDYEDSQFESIKWLKLIKKDGILSVTYHIDIHYQTWASTYTIPEFAKEYINTLEREGFKAQSSEEVETEFTVLAEKSLDATSIHIGLDETINKLEQLYITTESNFTGIVYVLTNPAMPGIVKIGKTSRDSVDARLNELYSTGVPVPFECAFAGRVKDESKIEKAFHLAFGPYRLNPKREFFQIEPEQAIALLELMVTDDVTPDLQAEASKVDTEAKAGVQKLKARRPVQNFLEMGIPEGSTLQFTHSDEICTVLNGRRVLYKEEDISLTALTKRLLNTDRPLQPSPYWLFNSRKLTDIYNETYE